VAINSHLVHQSLTALREVVGSGPSPLHAPIFSGNEWLFVKQCLDSTYVSSVGQFVDRFEADLVRYTGARHAIAMVNGTAALHISLLIAGVQDDDEVLVPALTFVATANAVSYCNAIPHFIDSDEATLGISSRALRSYLESKTKREKGYCVNKSTGRIIRALLPMHTFGHPSQLDELLQIADEFQLTLIEDAAESLGSFYRGRHTGTFGRLGVLSFNGNKIITTGGGGAILTNDTALAHRAKHLTTTAKKPHIWNYDHDEIGYNYRMPNLNAALGCAQIEQMPSLLKWKRELFGAYSNAFANVEGLSVVEEPEYCESNYWLQTLLLDENHVSQRDLLLSEFNNAGYGSRPAWKLLSHLKPYLTCPSMELPVAESLSKRLLNIPSGVTFGETR